MSAQEPTTGEPSPNGAEPSAQGTDLPAQGGESGQPRYEPPPSVGKLLIWVLLFVLAAVVVVLGGVYFT
ncbi:hypothetical protein [Streptomyces rhizosphaerihabitans]|uniref:hypothetical protein n=1 Tax=Streptomyces rhizosphaerihabitans TaxID=1266770 RepID=UPI0021BE5737|nr:hypothetical protein [Streptomyces rhizosphaerihabitans]MCT9010639.1 hypothetical protein [Streptomyces rhizosphaerihabitans]